MRTITIGASDVAACIGLNPYQSSESIVKKIISRYFPNNGVITNEQKAIELLASTEISTQINLDISTQAGAISTSVMNQIVKDASNKLDGVFEEEDKKLVVDYLQSKANTIHGIRNEDKTAEDCNRQTDRMLIKDSRFHCFTLLQTEKYLFQLVGKIDRLELDEDGKMTLIEIKNRVNRLFNCVKEYEHIQVQTYLKLLDLENAKLIEQYRDKQTMNTFPILRDRTFWEETILPGLISFCKKIEDTVLME